MREFDVKSLAVVPMHNNAHVVGVIVIENYKEKTIKRAYMNLLETIARLFGTSMHLQKTVEHAENLIIEEVISPEELQHMRAELTALIGDLGSNQQSFVEKLAKAVDEKGQYKVAHSQRTAELSKKLCHQIGLNEKTTDLVYYAGLLQNIGKITLPESLFTNKGKLSKEEKICLLQKAIDNIVGTYYRQTLFAEYELIVSKKVEQGEPITYRTLSYFEILIDLEVKDVNHLNTIIAALKASKVISYVSRATQ